MKREAVTVPDLGGAEEVEVIEIAVAPGARVVAEQTLITLESDKASMEIPSPLAGEVQEIAVQVGQRVRKGDVILYVGVAGAAVAAEPPAASAPEQAAPPPAPVVAAEPPVPPSLPVADMDAAPAAEPAAAADAPDAVVVTVPQLGGAESVEVIEIAARSGDRVAEGATLMVLESDKATMELPAPVAGVVVSIDVRVGERVAGGQPVARIAGGDAAVPVRAAAPAPAQERRAAPRAEAVVPVLPVASPPPGEDGDTMSAINRMFEKGQQRALGAQARAADPATALYAGPAVRQLARELGVTLKEVPGSGPKGRILKEDVQTFVKRRLAAPPAAALPTIPAVDFAAFGAIETVALNGVQRATVTNMARSWLNVPHVTQFDFADVTALEEFREGLKAEMAERGNKLSPLPFLLRAVAAALAAHPRVNSSLHPDGQRLVLKKYIHIGIAVDTPAGLVVPVIRDVGAKGVWELAAEARDLAVRARERKLKPAEMQGGCFTVSSLGSIGGEGFTPIVNAPEVAILGVSKLAIRPVWDGKAFVPRKTLPLSLSYDHRVINGADAGNFLTFLVQLLADLRRLLL